MPTTPIFSEFSSVSGEPLLDAGLVRNLLGALDPSGMVSHAVPAGLGWDSGSYPVTIGADFSGRGTAGIKPRDFFPDYTSRPTYWVDVARPDDTGDGLTEATAKRTIARAVELANTGGVPARIRVKAGFYHRNRTFSHGGAVPAVDIVFEAYNGRVIAAAAAADLVWQVNATFPHVTQAAVSGVSTAWDIRSRDEDGFYGEIFKVSTLNDVAEVPNSWAEVGGIFYVNRQDRASAADANTRVLVAIDNLRIDGTQQCSILLTGSTGKDGFDLEGGQAGCWRTLYTGGESGDSQVHAAENCTFRYSGHSSGAVGNVAIEGLKGLAFFENCDASNGATDCWNIHNALGVGSVPSFVTYALTVNCSGVRGGKFNYVSCNGWTAHDNVIGIDIGGFYSKNRGRTIHLIQDSKALFVRTTAINSLGDKVSIGANDPGELTVEDAAEIWVDTANIGSLSGLLAAGAYDTGSIHLRRTPLRGMTYADAGASIDAYEP